MSKTLVPFHYEKMEFSKDGQLDELIALDRYAVQTYDDFRVGDTVVVITDEVMGTKKVGTIDGILGEDSYRVRDRLGEFHNVRKELLQKPLETKPHHFWTRWAKGGSSVEKTDELKAYWENEFRWLFDGYRYSLGGRIQLMLGQEYLTGEKANLTAYNCYVIKSPRAKRSPVKQFLEVLEVARYEGNIMRRGGGVGINISDILTTDGSGRTKGFFQFHLPSDHRDHGELKDREGLGKFESVTLADQIEDSKRAARIIVGDSVEELFDSMVEMVEKAYDESVDYVLLDFSKVRHRNAIVKGVNGRSSGAVSWMELFVLIASLLQQKTIDNVEFAEIFSFIVHLIIQGGSRRGALMLVCNDDNSEVSKFITRKTKKGYLSGANISVGISDGFMNKVKEAKETKTPNKESELWTLITTSAHGSAEPGVLWMERYNKESNSNYYEEGYIVATNPCGEQGLPEFSVCNLGHFVLPRFYDSKTNDVNWDDLARACRAAVRLQDNVIDYTPYFLEENKKQQMSERRVGIGSLGLGTLLIKMKLRYGSEEGNAFADKLYKFIAYHEYKASIDIAKEKGAFPKFDYKGFASSEYMKRLLSEFPGLKTDLQKYGIRNVTLNTQAPTGTTGTYIDNIPQFREEFGGTTTGIEPYYSWTYWRAGRLGMHEQTVQFVHDYMVQHKIKDAKNLPSYFVTAMELKPEEHVKVQAVVQKWTDSSISKTANCPSGYTVEQVEELYTLSYDLGLKGMTIYRDGSREAQVLATKKEDAKLESHIEATEAKKVKQKSSNASIERDETRTFTFEKRPKRLYGFTDKIGFTCGDKYGKAYVTINLKDGQPWEVFISTKVKEASSLAKALGLMSTKMLRLGAADDNLQQVIDTLSYDQTMGTLPAGLANILRSLQKDPVSIVPIKLNSDEANAMAELSDELKKTIQGFQSQQKSGSGLTECPSCGENHFDKVNCVCHKCGSGKCN
ncbi:hypothetical protein IMZ31_21370 (plasmid) [Pontibacillus sp. ALD_SL1]|uniref:hypothetical protein n=1 Tax=Pontibacillus sp. ALD_SL1 TaxID=2777185 RepID=UPI001A95C135|nr:hypothetical protein [Pontibacillus sp. ALD_SL1]QST03102.1 hypothetical protein IMZ31_21370 [Pontibacillus sp. ALD_SL1]